MLINNVYLGMLALFSIFLFISVIYYFIKPAPSGDRAVNWALGIFYLAGLAVSVTIALLFWQIRAIGIFFLSIPVAFLILPFFKRKLIAFYAWLPSGQRHFRKNAPPLKIQITNNTGATIQIQLECWFGGLDKSSFSLFKTIDFISAPFENNFHIISRYSRGLLSDKARHVRILIFECLAEKGEGYQYMRKIQPCMQMKEVSPDAFLNGEYRIHIDAASNSEMFKSEIRMLKEINMYANGTF